MFVSCWCRMELNFLNNDFGLVNYLTNSIDIGVVMLIAIVAV